MGKIISFRVVKEPYGWAVRIGEGMMTPFRSQAMALQHAAGLVEALRRCGEFAEVVVVEDVPTVTDVRASRGPPIRDRLHDGRI